MDLLSARKVLDSGRTIFEMPLRVVFYARVSSDTDVQLNSLENQIAHYDDYIKSYSNWTYCGGYIDEGLSGASVAKREEFLKMVSDGEAGKFDLIITKEISRFARDTLDSIMYTRKLLDCGVGVFFQSDNINTLYPDSELRLTIMASLAQDELRRLSERVKFGMRRAYKDGKVLGQNNIYGYNKAKGKLIINEEEACFIRELFNLYAEDKYGFRKLTQILTEKGYRNQEGGELNPGSLKGILTNPKYKGFYYGRKTESSDYRKKTNIKVAEEDRLLYKDESIPAIVSEELWDRVNVIINRRSEKYYNEGNGSINRFAYSGKIYCEEHDTPHYRKMWTDRKVPAESWCCKLYLSKGRKACSTPHLYTRDLDAILEYIGNDLLSNKEKYIRSVDNLIELYKRAEMSNDDYTDTIAKTVKMIEKIKLKQDRLLDLYTDDRMSKDDYLDKDSRLKAEITKLNQRLAILKEEQVQASNTGASLANVRSFFEDLADSVGDAFEVAKAMLDSVYVLKGSTSKDIRIRIKMKYGEVIPCAIAIPFTLYGKTEVSPVVGTEKQSEELVRYLLSEFESDPAKIWQTNIFGKSLHELVKEGLSNKLSRMPEDAQLKIAETLQRIINEGSGGLLCILL